MKQTFSSWMSGFWCAGRAAMARSAADLSLAPLYKAPPTQYSPAYNWTGFYLGVNGGGGWGDSHWQGIGHTNAFRRSGRRHRRL